MRPDAKSGGVLRRSYYGRTNDSFQGELIMSTTTAKEFIHKVESDPALTAKLRAIPLSSREQALAEVVQIAAAEGFAFTAPDYETAFKEHLMEHHASGEISDEELARVAGGLRHAHCGPDWPGGCR
jgi:predicted ribosomally synthesized peptide with nif11-like leader